VKGNPILPPIGRDHTILCALLAVSRADLIQIRVEPERQR
jgi:hypothetical protein